jgi:hypothetical protein
MRESLGVRVCELGVEPVELVIAEMLEADEIIVGVTCRSDQLIELEVNRVGVAVLGALDQEHHQERDDRRPRVDDELPSVGESEDRAGECPDCDHGQRDQERTRRANHERDPMSEAPEAVAA